MALKKLPDLPIEIVREKFSYDALTGLITWKADGYHNTVRAGDIAGCLSAHGYVVVAVRIAGHHHRIFAHRLAWALVCRTWPSGVIDHKDGNPQNNAIANLREANHTINGQNRRRAQSNNRTSGVLGVTLLRSGKWRAMITVNKRRTHIGCFATADEAHQAYLDAKRTFHEGCTI